MGRLKTSSRELSDLLLYLAKLPCDKRQRIPSLTELSKILETSVASLREQLEVARFLGIVDVKPKAGITLLPYSFKPALMTSLTYAVESGAVPFQQYSDLRKHLEAAYFIDAARMLSKTDLDKLVDLIKSAQAKIKEIPGKNPVTEHRQFHLQFYEKLNNEFLKGIFEAYWDLYRIEGLEIYSDLVYAERVWQYHARIVEQLYQGNFNQGLILLMEHMEILNQREKVFPDFPLNNSN